MNKPYNYEDDFEARLATRHERNKQRQLATISWIIQALISVSISFVTTLATLIAVTLLKG